VDNPGPINVAYLGKFPGRRECLTQNLRHFGVNIIEWQGDSLSLGGFPDGDSAPAILLLDLEELIRTVNDLSVLLLGLKVVSPDTRVVLRADMEARSPLGEICVINELSVVPTSMDWRELARSIRDAGNGGHTFLEAKRPPLEGPMRGFDRGRRR